METRERMKNVMMAKSGREKGDTHKKKKHKMKMVTWNVRTMLKPGRMCEIVGEVKKYGIDLVALQEVKWKGQGEINKSNYTLKYSGAEKQSKHRVGFAIMEKLRKNVMEFNAINKKLAYIRIKAKSLNILILNIYALLTTPI